MSKENISRRPALASSTTSTISAATALPPGRQTEWKYRGRSNSEATNTEPVSAPTGLPAQKSEGFQRFYKAVVSPTHVRVTAGGRIVPNTRAPPSPTAKRAAGNTTSQDSYGDKYSNAKPTTAPLNTAQQAPPGVPQYFPGFPSAFPPVPAFLPMPFPPTMPGGFPFPLAVGGHIMPQHTMENAARDLYGLHTGDGQTDRSTEPNKEGDAKPSKPEPLDPTKSFVYNNPWIFPMAPPFPHPMGGHPFMPGPMLGHPPFMGHPPMPPHLFPPPNVGVPVSTAGVFSAPSLQAGFTGTAATPGPSNKAFQSPATPPISSIKPSEITKKQIASFRASLKYHEDQLQYNRHQIDEKAMENKVKAIQEHIQHFETLLQSQLEHERMYYPKSEKGRDTDTDSITEPSTAQNIQDHGVAPHYASAAHPASRKPRCLSEITDTPSDNKGGPAIPNFDPSAHAVQPAAEINKQTGLPTDAALAPPFRPRGETRTQTATNDSSMSWDKADNLGTAQKDLGRGLVSASDQRWQVFSGSSDISTEASLKFCGDSIANSRPASRPAVSVKAKARLGVPYLIGTLPKGTDSRGARDTDYQYARELNKDEVRARHLYWGKAPHFVRQGLPQYDGRNFYPPSPVGGSAAADSADQEQLQATFENRLPTVTTKIDDNLDTSKPAVDQSRPTDPFQSIGVMRNSNRPKALSSDDTFSPLTRDRMFRSRARSDSDDFEQLTERRDKAGYPSRQKPTYADARSNIKSLASNDKRSDKPGYALEVPSPTRLVDLWLTRSSRSTRLPPTVLRKGCTSSAVSSTTVQGYLPQYFGHASKALSPPFHKPAFSPNRNESPTKASDIDLKDGGALLSPIPEKKGENRPPNGEGSLEEQFRTVVSTGLADRGNLSSTLNL